MPNIIIIIIIIRFVKRQNVKRLPWRFFQVKRYIDFLTSDMGGLFVLERR